MHGASETTNIQNEMLFKCFIDSMKCTSAVQSDQSRLAQSMGNLKRVSTIFLFLSDCIRNNLKRLFLKM